MAFIIIFVISGLAIILLVVAKSLGEKRRRSFFILNAISKGDTHVREFYHKAVRSYSEGKEKVLFFFKKQIPIHSKNSSNKLLSFLKEKKERYTNNIRDSKSLKKSDGISEFFKNMSNIEKGNGEINDVYENDSQEDKKEVK